MKDYLIKLFAVIGIILIAALGSFSAYAEEVSVESACDMITASIPEKEVNVYLCKTMKTKNCTGSFSLTQTLGQTGAISATLPRC